MAVGKRFINLPSNMYLRPSEALGVSSAHFDPLKNFVFDRKPNHIKIFKHEYKEK